MVAQVFACDWNFLVFLVDTVDKNHLWKKESLLPSLHANPNG